MRLRLFILALLLTPCFTAEAQTEKWWLPTLKEDFGSDDGVTAVSGGDCETLTSFPAFRNGASGAGNKYYYFRKYAGAINFYYASYYLQIGLKKGDFVVVNNFIPDVQGNGYKPDATIPMILSKADRENGTKWSSKAKFPKSLSVVEDYPVQDCYNFVYKCETAGSVCVDVRREKKSQAELSDAMTYDFMVDRYGAIASMSLLTHAGQSFDEYLDENKADFASMSEKALISRLSHEFICIVKDTYDRTVYVACPQICWSVDDKGAISFQPYFIPVSFSSFVATAANLYEWDMADESPKAVSKAIADAAFDVYASEGSLISKSGGKFYVYNLQGSLVSIADNGHVSVSQGLYLVKQGGGSAKKLIVK